MPTEQQATVLDPDMHTGQTPTGKVCIANISLKERRKRLTGGVISLVISVAVLAVLMAFGASRWWRLALLPLFASATVGFYQWRDKT